MKFFHWIAKKLGIKVRKKKEPKKVEKPKISEEDIIKNFLCYFKRIIPDDLELHQVYIGFRSKINAPEKIAELFKMCINRKSKYEQEIISKTKEYLSACNYIMAMIDTRNKMTSVYNKECNNDNVNWKVCEKSYANLKEKLKEVKEKFYTTKKYEDIQRILGLRNSKNCLIEALEQGYISHFYSYKLQPAEKFKQLTEATSLFKFNELKLSILEKVKDTDREKYKSEIKKIENETIKSDQWLKKSYKNLVINKIDSIEEIKKNLASHKIVGCIPQNTYISGTIHYLFSKVYNVSMDHVNFLNLINDEEKRKIENEIQIFKKKIEILFGIYPFEDKPKDANVDEMIEYFAKFSDEWQNNLEVLGALGVLEEDGKLD